MDDRKRLSFIFKLQFAILVAAQCGLASDLQGQTAYEIWAPTLDQSTPNTSFGTSLFRKNLILTEPEESEILISAKDNYELYVNGQFVTVGQSSGASFRIRVQPYLTPGLNTISVKVTHQSSPTAGLALKFRVREKGEQRWRSLVTDDSWKTSSTETSDQWSSNSFDISNWQPANKLATFDFLASQITDLATQSPATKQVAQSNSDLPETTTSSTDLQSPVPNAEVAVKSDTESAELATETEQNAEADRSGTMGGRFTIDEEFKVQQVMLDSETGSVIAMAFNEFGQLILSQERGPLLLADITKEPDSPGRIRVLCESVKSCQGILPLNGKIYVTGYGPSGLALYRLFDNDRDGMFEVEKVMVPFKGKPSEHGPHGIELGPDGMIYVTVGNASSSTTAAAKSSPYLNTYEGDLVPRMEDPGGHAVGIEAPGGTIIRTSLNGDFVETVNGGLRNIYDLVFDQYGELFLHDSDLETNIGMAWYRPTRIYHAPQGGDLGWRSGWSKFPNYFPDVVPPVASTGRGSPSGATLYQHFQFPARYHNTIFFADWSEGRILAGHPEPAGAGYKMDVEVFCSGRPMNVTDLAVGTDGTLFFSTGGRGTSGGVYRIAWNGKIPEELYSYSNEFERVIRMPQPKSAWGRQAIATLKKQLGESWGPTLQGIAQDQRNEIDYRLRAIDLLYFYGPFPTNELVEQLAGDEDQRVRAAIATLCGVKQDNGLNANLEQLISDKSPLVRRKAAEAFMKIGKLPTTGKILAMLGSDDRTEATVARRLIEKAPLDTYEQAINSTEELTLFVNGAISIMTAKPSLDSAYRILTRVTHFMDGYLNDREFVDLLRVAQLALVQANVDPYKIPGFGERIAAEFPAGNGQINKQLAMIMAYMKTADSSARIVEYFKSSDNTPTDKIYIAMLFQSIGYNMDDDSRLAIVDYLEKAINFQDGTTYRNYIGTSIKQLTSNIKQPEQIQRILENGANWPNAMLQAFFNLDQRLTAEQVQLVIAADRKMQGDENVTTRKIRLGSIAVLAESRVQEAHEYLREIWQSRPDYRNEICLGMAQQADGANWPYLVTSMPILDDTIGKEVVQALITVNRRPKKPRQYRELIEMGFRLRDSGAMEVSKLLKHWTGNEIQFASASSGKRWEKTMNFWSGWYKENWPNELPVNVKPLAKVGEHSAERVLAHLEEFEVEANPAVGKLVFQKANCSACHRIGNEGATFGPDLSNLANRFSRREILESIIDPSRVVSDQYQSKKILTVDGEQLFGMLIKDTSGDYLLQDTTGRTVRIAEDDIEQMEDSELSSMPNGLLDNLSLDEIMHLFEFLQNGTKATNTAARQSFVPSVN